MADEMWDVIHAERRTLAGDLAGLTPERWQAPSLCQGWSAPGSRPSGLHRSARAGHVPLWLAFSGFTFDRFTAKRIAAEGAGGHAATPANFRAVEKNTSSPPRAEPELAR